MSAPTFIEQIAALQAQAQARLAELDAEREQIIAAFPQLKKYGRSGASAHSTKGNGHTVLFAADEATTKAGKRRVQRRFTPEQKAAVLDRVRNGETAPVIAKELGLHASSIHDWARKAGVKPKSATIDASGITLAWLREVDRAVTLAEGMAKFGLDYGATDQRLRKLAARGLARRIAPSTYELTAKGRGDAHASNGTNGTNGTNGNRAMPADKHEQGIALAKAGKSYRAIQAALGITQHQARKIKIAAAAAGGKDARRLDVDLVKRAKDMLRRGVSQKEIKAALGVTNGAIYRFKEQMKKEARS